MALAQTLKQIAINYNNMPDIEYQNIIYTKVLDKLYAAANIGQLGETIIISELFNSKYYSDKDKKILSNIISLLEDDGFEIYQQEDYSLISNKRLTVLWKK